jgi:hypothetical protein
MMSLRGKKEDGSGVVGNCRWTATVVALGRLARGPSYPVKFQTGIATILRGNDT